MPGEIRVPIFSDPLNKDENFEVRPLNQIYIRSLWTGFQDRKLFADVKNYCTFIGHPRSGHSLIGSLLDAHPEMSVAHEADALNLLNASFSRRQVFSYLIRNSRQFARRGRGWSGYSYEVAGQWQGRWSTLRVIGDKNAGGTIFRKLALDEDFWKRIPALLCAQMKFIHVVRNPYDNITTISRKRGAIAHPDRKIIDQYFSRCDLIQGFKTKIRPLQLLTLRLEDFIKNPTTHLKAACEFLGLEASEDYLKACASIVRESPHESRRWLKWDDDLIQDVAERIQRYDFLKGYAYFNSSSPDQSPANGIAAHYAV
jgi:hypothetical protein